MKETILSALKHTDGYLSGEELSRTLGVTRSAVWKNINLLRQEGYLIDSVPNRGYCLKKNPDLLDAEKIMKDIHINAITKKLLLFKTIDSTNNELKRLAAKGEPGGTVAASEIQTGGRGRFGRQWQSDKGGLYFSFLLRPELPPGEIAAITLAAGYAVCLAVREYTGLDARIKWPNDVIIGNHKICGILTEMAAQSDRLEYVVTGIGINLNTTKFPEELHTKATSLSLQTGKEIDKSDFFRTVLISLDRVLSSFLISVSLEDMQHFKELCATLEREVSVERNGTVLHGTAVDISPVGELIIQTQSGLEKIASGEVTVQGIY